MTTSIQQLHDKHKVQLSNDIFNQSTYGALFSDAKKYRHVLIRIWNKNKPRVAFIGLNPSTADERQNDNTITKVIKIADHNGFGGLYMLNLFSIVSADPRILKRGDSYIPDLDKVVLTTYGKDVTHVVFCWGNFNEAVHRGLEVKEIFPGAYCIAQNKNGSPKHPLYCRDNSILKPYRYG